MSCVEYDKGEREGGRGVGNRLYGQDILRLHDTFVR